MNISEICESLSVSVCYGERLMFGSGPVTLNTEHWTDSHTNTDDLHMHINTQYDFIAVQWMSSDPTGPHNEPVRTCRYCRIFISRTTFLQRFLIISSTAVVLFIAFIKQDKLLLLKCFCASSFTINDTWYFVCNEWNSHTLCMYIFVIFYNNQYCGSV